LAAYQNLDLPPWEEGKFWNWFTLVAKAHAAGGVVARKLMPSSEGGDSNDRERFKNLCEEINAKDPNMKHDWKPLWKAAQDKVEQEISNPEFLARIQAVTAEIQPDLGL
jgi:hypothetical protein